MIIALVPNIQESYVNVKHILEKVDISAIQFALSADIKMYLTLIGKQSAGCTCNCPFCEGQSPWSEGCWLLTVGRLKQLHNNFVAEGSDVRQAKLHGNVFHQPLVSGDDDEKILNMLAPPENHLLTGVVGKVVLEMEKAGWSTQKQGELWVREFLRRENCSKASYHGTNSFEGNQARSLLRKADILKRDILAEGFDVAVKCLPFVETLKKFNGVVSACFGQELDPTYEEKITQFSQLYRSLGCTVPPKVHIVEVHVAQFLKMRGEKYGLGMLSEQAMESCHHDFKIEWENRKVGLSHSELGDRLLDTVVRYNSKHL